jgi:hypothetical protein
VLPYGPFVQIIYLRTYIPNIVRTWGTNWEIDENTLGTKKNNKKPPPLPCNPKGKKSRHLEHMHIFSLAACNFSSQNCSSPFLG